MARTPLLVLALIMAQVGLLNSFTWAPRIPLVNAPTRKAAQSLAVIKGPDEVNQNISEKEENPKNMTEEQEIKYISDAKKKLLGLLPIQNIPAKIEADKLISMLEASYTPILTTGFFNLGIKGTWQLVYSTVPMPRPAEGLALSPFTQKIEPGGSSGIIENSFQWEEYEGGSSDALLSNGNFTVKANYALTPRSHLDVTVNQNMMKPEKMPEDVQATIKKFQETIPPEFLNPNASVIETRYCDTDMRIVQFIGDDYRLGIKNVFTRVGQLEFDD